MVDLCLHCLEEYNWELNMPDQTCPTCHAAGHPNEGKCAICDKQFSDKMDALKAAIDLRVELIDVIERHLVVSTAEYNRCPMCRQEGLPNTQLCDECRNSCNRALYELIESRTNALKSRPKCVTPLNNEAM